MRERLLGIVNGGRDRWKALGRNQKIQIIAIAAVIVLALVFTLYLTMRTKMVMLVDNKDLTVISEMRAAVSDAGIASRVTDSGRGLEVDAKRAVDAQVILAEQNLMSDTSGNLFTYQDALSYSGMGTTETIKKENLKKAKESELSQALTTFTGITGAVVTLTLPENSTFFREPVDQARASALITTSRTLDKSEALGIANFLRASVDGLTLDNIEIIDQNYNLVYSGSQGANGGIGTALEQEQDRKTEMEMKLRAQLAPLADEIKVTANLKFDWSSSSTDSTQFQTPVAGSDTGIVSSETVTSQSSTGTQTGGEPGTNANAQTTPQYQAGGAAGASAKANSRTSDYAVNRTDTHTETAVGGLLPDQSSIAIMLYYHPVYDQAQMTAGGSLSGQTWDQFKAATATREVPVDQSIVDNVVAATGIANVSVKAYEIPHFVDEVKTAMNVQQIIIFVVLAILILLLAYGIIARAKPAVITETEPELSVEELLMSTRMDEEKETEAEKLMEIEFNKESETKKQIEKFVAERPEAVAQLLRNWLNNEWE
ncbi:MAG: flagellar M-ring protein FliF [Defluviitaleaceae bacterium]|nr:flagellar M-ring protein FliF [Defluviitaleaceae bacterium]